jgi:hypothetical protein
MLLIFGVFFGFLLNRLLKLKLSNIDAKVEQAFREQQLARAESIASELPAALAPVVSERELVTACLVFPNDYEHSASIIRVNLMHGDTLLSTWSTIVISSVQTISLSLKGRISENQLPADLTLVAHAIVDREHLDMRDCLVDIRAGDYYAECVVLVSADAPTAISVSMLRLPS